VGLCGSARVRAAGVAQVYSTEEGDLAIALKLDAANDLVGVVVNQAGDAVAGAEIHVIEPDGLIKLDGSVPRPMRAPTSQRSRGRALSGDDGRFAVAPPWGRRASSSCTSRESPRVADAKTMMGGAGGVGSVGGAAGAGEPKKIVLEPWANVEGVVAESLRTKQPQTVSAVLDQYIGPGRLRYDPTTKVGPDGSFRFANVPPGEVTIGVEETFERERSLVTVMDHMVRLDASAGQQIQSKVGGAGEGVTGIVALASGVSGDLASSASSSRNCAACRCRTKCFPGRT
jgi:hypothetical protein